MLCNMCAKHIYGKGKKGQRQYGPHHAWGKTLDEAASNGCYVCRIVVQCLVREGRNVVDVEKFSANFSQRTLTIIGLNELPEDWWIKHCSFKMVAIEDQSHLSRVTRRKVTKSGFCSWDVNDDELRLKLPASTGNEQALFQARVWYEDCIEKHRPHTNEIARQSIRLIDVSLPVPHLMSFSQDAVNGRYAAFTYGAEAETPSLSNLKTEDGAAGIPLRSLPPVVQDALIVTQAMGVSFCWVDSICRPGAPDGCGSMKPSLEEGTRVALQNAALVISSCKTSKVKGGLFVDRGPPYIPYQHILWTEKRRRFRLSTPPKPFVLFHTRDFDRQLLRATRMTAKRVLPFGQSQMSFCCSHGGALGCYRNETFPDGLPEWLLSEREVE